jgi:hypothetical protein
MASGNGWSEDIPSVSQLGTDEDLEFPHPVFALK